MRTFNTIRGWLRFAVICFFVWKVGGLVLKYNPVLVSEIGNQVAMAGPIVVMIIGMVVLIKSVFK